MLWVVSPESTKILVMPKFTPDLDYASIEGLRLEARQKLDRIKPRTLAQAMGISGVSPADAAVLMLHVKQSKSCDPAAGKEED